MANIFISYNRKTEAVAKTLADDLEALNITLNYERQSTLLVDLKRSLREPETTDDAHVLLERLRKRRDLLATIAEEIDELLTSKREVSRHPAHSSELEPPTQKHALTRQLQGKIEDFEPEFAIGRKTRTCSWNDYGSILLPPGAGYLWNCNCSGE